MPPPALIRRSHDRCSSRIAASFSRRITRAFNPSSDRSLASASAGTEAAAIGPAKSVPHFRNILRVAIDCLLMSPSSGADLEVPVDIELAGMPNDGTDGAHVQAPGPAVIADAGIVHDVQVQQHGAERAVARLFQPVHEIDAIADLHE